MRKVALLIGFALLASPAAAQLRTITVATGLSAPVAFVQDPSDSSVQYIVEQGGRIRVVRSGTLLATDFLDVSASIVSGGEQGLLGLAFPPDYGTSGRFYVNFTNPAGDTVVARFKRAATSPPRADPASRLDMLWSTGERVIRQPFANHNGGNIAFGSDGYLYIGMGDGGSGDDPFNNAQTPSSLLGKMLRIDVSVPDSNTTGFRVPGDNPFVNAAGTRPEIWSFGLRNPFRWSFDDTSRGGTGALVIGDVGQNRFEEIDYEPALRGGRNYGWHNREGAHDEVLTSPPAFLPLTEPIFEYTHADGISVIGGFLYRGSALAAANRGRYFYGDLVGRVWSLALTINPSTLEATASDLREHTAELGGQAALGNISSFGVDAAGEIYICSYSGGKILKIAANSAPAPVMSVDAPANGARLREPFVVGGWALDLSAASGTGIDAIHVWAYPTSGAAPIFVGAAPYGGARPDLVPFVGGQFTNAGFGMLARGIPPGRYLLVVFAHVVATNAFGIAKAIDITIDPSTFLSIDAPARNASVSQPFVVGGWAIDGSAASGSGVDTIHVWAYPTTGAAPVFLGVPALGGGRPDVGGIFGSQFAAAGFNLLVSHLAAGTWDLVVYVHSGVSHNFEVAQVVRITSSGF